MRPTLLRCDCCRAGKSASLFGWIRLHVMHKRWTWLHDIATMVAMKHWYLWILWLECWENLGKGWDKLGKGWGKLCRVLTRNYFGRLVRRKVGRTGGKLDSFYSSPSHPQVFPKNLPPLFTQIFPTSSPKRSPRLLEVFQKSSLNFPRTFLQAFPHFVQLSGKWPHYEDVCCKHDKEKKMYSRNVVCSM